MSLRTRLLALLVALVTLGFATAGIATHRLLKSRLLDRVDQQYEQLYESLVAASETTGQPRFGGRPSLSPEAYFELVFQQLLPPGAGLSYRDAGGETSRVIRQIGADTDPPAPELPRSIAYGRFGATSTDAFESSASGGERFRTYAVRDARGARLVVWLPLADVDDTLSNLVNIELVIAAIAIVLAAGVGWWLVRIGLRPLDEVSDTADAIAGGDLTRRVEVTHPNTEVGRLGLAFNEMLTRIEAAFEEQRASEARLRQFVADASHELRTPLTSVRGYAELFRSGAATRPDDLAKVMARVEAEARRMSVLVDDLLLLARLDQGRPLATDRLDLTGLVVEAVERAQEIDPSHPFALDAPAPVPVVGDEDRLRQVVDNLLTNVQHHTPAGPPTIVRVRAEDDDAWIEVSDRGPGLAEEDRVRIFERFYRADASRTRDSGGSGLGLSIVAAIAGAHGGEATVASTPGEGTTFRIRLPLAHAADPAHATAGDGAVTP